MKIDPIISSNKLTLNNAQNLNSEKNFNDILKQVEQNKDDDKKLKEASQELESVFVHKMISQMRAAIPKGGLFTESQGEQMFQDMLDTEYAKEISKTGGIGLAEIIYNQLSQKNKTNPEIENKAKNNNVTQE